MSEFRWDPLKANWVITRNSRERSPQEFIIKRQKIDMLSCPFCPGQEDKTPPEVYVATDPTLPAGINNWLVRVVPNKFPILRIEGSLTATRDGLHEKLPGIGAHEVIIETRDHHRSMAELDITEITAVLQAYRARLLDLRKDTRFRYLQIFKNHGLEAGAPVSHSHSQLMAVPITPPLTRTMLQTSKDYFQAHQRCLCCDMVAQEMAEKSRVISSDEHFVAFTPYASRSPFETRLYPINHCHDFALQDDDSLARCAVALQALLRRQHNLLEDPPYNFILHTAPPIGPKTEQKKYWHTLAQDFHWHFELVPRINEVAGFEWGSGFYINAMLPELAAQHLRETDPELAY